MQPRAVLKISIKYSAEQRQGFSSHYLTIINMLSTTQANLGTLF
jgi:hypothetical protein